MYRELLRNKDIRLCLILGIITRIPTFTIAVVITLHVVSNLKLDYASAGIATAVVTITGMIASPIRGAMIDRKGIRRTAYPSLIIVTLSWGFAPFVNYSPMLVLLSIGALWQYPVFTLTRQIMMAATNNSNRKLALSMDAVAVEICYMIGPILGIIAATSWSVRGTILVGIALMNLGVLGFAITNPNIIDSADTAEEIAKDLANSKEPITTAVTTNISYHLDNDKTGSYLKRFCPAWLTPSLLGILLNTAVSGFTIGAFELATVAAMRDFNASDKIGWALALSGLGSAMGGIIYGTSKRHLSPTLLLILLSLCTGIPCIGQTPLQLVLLTWFCGIFYAPFSAAITEQISFHVPPKMRGQILGFQGSCISAGIALAAPIAGAIIDATTWQLGYLVAAIVGVIVGGGVMLARHIISDTSNQSQFPNNTKRRSAYPDS